MNVDVVLWHPFSIIIRIIINSSSGRISCSCSSIVEVVELTLCNINNSLGDCLFVCLSNLRIVAKLQNGTQCAGFIRASI